MDRGKRMRPERRERVQLEAIVAYQSGSSIRAIAQQQGLAYATIHRLLLDGGVTFRPRGGNTRGRR